jgi:hypothetical protein
MEIKGDKIKTHIPEHFNSSLLEKYDDLELDNMLLKLLDKHDIYLSGSLYDILRGRSPSNPQAIYEAMLLIQEICVRHNQRKSNDG